MGNACVKKRKGLPRSLTLAILGLDNAGKTVTTKGLQGETLDNVAPTIGFSDASFKFDGIDITMFDLGGGKRIRGIWKNYFSEVYGVIYVIDSSEPERMDECRLTLSTLLENEKVRGKPILILANKQDVTGALDEIDICEMLNLEELVNSNKCPCRVETCSAIMGQGKRLDRAIKSGMTWMIDTIHNSYSRLHERVERETAEQKAITAKERAERREQAQRQRAERERLEEEERIRNGGAPKAESGEDEPVNGDPFKRLDTEQLQNKAAALKAEKRRRGDQSSPVDHPPRGDLAPRGLQRRSSDPELLSATPRLNRRHQDGLGAVPPRAADDDTYTRLRLPYGPPLGPSPRLNTRRQVTADAQHLPALATPTLSPRAPGLPGLGAGEDEAESRALRFGHRPLVPLAPLEPLENASKKKKKKKAKKNQTTPLTSDPGLDEPDEGSYQPKVSPFAPRGWGTPPGQRSMMKASLTPRLETLREPENEKSDTDDHFANKWGLVDDLPDLPSANRSYMRPNSEYDDDIVT